MSIAAGALGKDLPVRDLRVTADHALLIDGVLVQAGALVNGTSIRRIEPAELGERFIVYHIETENHEIVLAEGAPAETFIDNVSRQRFDNYARVRGALRCRARADAGTATAEGDERAAGTACDPRAYCGGRSGAGARAG